MPAARAASPSRAVVGPGTATAWSSRRCINGPSCHAGNRHTQSGYAGMNASGNTTREAPPAAASWASAHAFSVVPSRSRNTGVAWTAATVARVTRHDVHRRPRPHHGPIGGADPEAHRARVTSEMFPRDPASTYAGATVQPERQPV